VPKAVKVIAIPQAKTSDNLKAFLGLSFPVPPTYPIIRGMVEREQGLTEVNTPAISAKIGASQKLSDISLDNDSSH
jgi:hypothetical protein